MSKVKETLNEQALTELMVVIRKNAEHSKCIDNFENLLKEIDDPVYVNTVVNSMHNFLTEAFELFYVVNRIPQKRFQSKMLTKEFIDPARFFSKVKILAEKSMKKRATIELMETRPHHELSQITVHTDGTPYILTIDKNADESFNEMCKLYDSKDKEFLERIEFLKELARKEMLVWNYIPAITKAILQTKRRSLDMDTNSKKFPVNMYNERFMYNGKEMTWKELPLDVKKQQYPYYFDDDGNETYPYIKL